MLSTKKNKLLQLVLACLIGLTAASNTYGAEDAIYIEKDQKAPFSGILFTEEHAGQLRRDLLESDKRLILLESELSKNQIYQSIGKLREQEIELYAKQNRRLERAESASNTMSYIWFGLGILATGVAVYGAGSLGR